MALLFFLRMAYFMCHKYFTKTEIQIILLLYDKYHAQEEFDLHWYFFKREFALKHAIDLFRRKIWI
jgi:hypothetical protein